MVPHLSFVSLLSVCAVLWLPGCGGGMDDMPDIGQVSGVITLNGKPGTELMVTFQPENGRPSYATTDETGAYELTYNSDVSGAKIGSNLVTISSASGENEDYGDGGSGEEGSLEEADAIPAKYNTLASTNPEMTVEVKAGSNEFNWDVK